MALPYTQLEIVKNENNLLDVDLATDLDPTDEVWFTAKYNRGDTDASAAIALTRSGGGIVDIDPSAGRCQVKIPKATASLLTGRALLFDVKVKKSDQATIQTVSAGVAVLIDSVNVNAA